MPGDKSITHRAIILGVLARGDTVVKGWVSAEVCLATLRRMRGLGAWRSWQGRIRQVCRFSRSMAPVVMDCASRPMSWIVLVGTTIRLLAGLLAGQPFLSVLTGTDPLRRRPMGRITEPLRLMGATILGRDGGRLAPLVIRGGGLHSIEYEMPIASVEVKLAILLAGLQADGQTTLAEPGPSRDHTETMLWLFGVVVHSDGRTVRLQGGQKLTAPAEGITIPGDFSSAAFPLVAALIVPGSEVRCSSERDSTQRGPDCSIS